MMKTATIIFLTVSLSLITGGLKAQEILYEEYFTDGTTDLEWTSAWIDSIGTPLTPMEVDSVDFNPSGDGWIGVVTGNVELLGGLGLAYAGDFDLMNYSIEAEVFVSPTSGYYNALTAYIDTIGGVVRGYQLVAGFNSAFGLERIRLRRYSSMQPEIEDLMDWEGEDIPGGPPTEDGWHTMKLEIENYGIRCYWDRTELTVDPIYDFELVKGPFGVYVFDFMGQSQTLIDDIVVRRTGTGIDEPGEENSVPLAFALGQNYPNPFNPSTTIPLTISDVEDLDNQHVILSIYDLRGREVRRLIDRPMQPGSYQIHWDGKDSAGRDLSSGVFIYKLRRGYESATHKMILAR
ncbi:MAG: T9SS type A sorting domain-containing protein [Candidatus Glassbacteria bacterium]